VLAGNILRLVNSALYGLPGTVNSIRHGVSLPGINKLRLLVAIGLHDEYKEISLHCKQKQTVQSWEALVQWNLPEPIRIAFRYHATPNLDPTPTATGYVTLSRVSHVADRYIKAIRVREWQRRWIRGFGGTRAGRSTANDRDRIR
jgi:HD-like signal output (HDOD) protein